MSDISPASDGARTFIERASVALGTATVDGRLLLRALTASTCARRSRTILRRHARSARFRGLRRMPARAGAARVARGGSIDDAHRLLRRLPLPRASSPSCRARSVDVSSTRARASMGRPSPSVDGSTAPPMSRVHSPALPAVSAEPAVVPPVVAGTCSPWGRWDPSRRRPRGELPDGAPGHPMHPASVLPVCPRLDAPPSSHLIAVNGRHM